MRLQAFFAALLTAALVVLVAIAGANALLRAFSQFSNAEVGSHFDTYVQLARFIIPGSAMITFHMRTRLQGPRLAVLRSVAIGSFTGLIALALTSLGCWASVSHVVP
jgi:hypothetical protein